MFNWNNHIYNIELAVFILFCVFFVIQLFYILRIYFPVILLKSKKIKVHAPISVIICAKNEGDNLRKNLKKILEQDHPNYEVIVVNDSSTDNTADVIGDFLIKYKHLKTTSLPPPSDPKFTHGKKLAVTLGIKAAKNDWLVFTDADCWPENESWLSSLQTGFDKKEIVLGYGGYKRHKSILNNFIRFETLNIALMYMGFAIRKKPYMGVGRNLAYRKELFFKNKGFASNYGILSGDDDLFINETANASNTEVVLERNSYTRSEAKTKWIQYFNQKVRHLSTANNYKPMHTFRLAMEPISRIWYYFLFVFLIVNKVFFIAVISIFSTRILIQFFLYLIAGRRFKEKNLWLSYIIFDVFALFFNFLAYFALTFRSKLIKWK